MYPLEVGDVITDGVKFGEVVHYKYGSAEVIVTYDSTITEQTVSRGSIKLVCRMRDRKDIDPL